MYKLLLKPLFDRVSAFILLLILFPIFILLSFATWISTSSKVFFIHERPGQNGKPFGLLKFKTMNDRRGVDGKLLPNMQRITGFGKVMRRLSLDEIPQLINVLKGDLSLIGPRPLEMRYINKKEAYH